MRYGLIVLWILFCSMTSAAAQVSVGIALPGVSIGINLPVYPELVRVPGYPVYYAPRLQSNYFFYDGMYWVYQGDNWYVSSWYNGPWALVAPEFVPLFILRIPVRYYRAPPAYFLRWRADAPPRWGQHWGNDWERNRRGWDKWNRSSAPAPAPLPLYQRRYSGNRYPRVEQQHEFRSQHYRYQPRDALVRRHYRAPAAQTAPVPSRRQEIPRDRSPGQRDIQRPAPLRQHAPAGSQSQRGRENVPRAEPNRDISQQQRRATVQREQPRARLSEDGKRSSQDPKRGQGREKDRKKDDR